MGLWLWLWRSLWLGMFGWASVGRLNRDKERDGIGWGVFVYIHMYLFIAVTLWQEISSFCLLSVKGQHPYS